jgi:hypothetical protein
MDCQGCWETFRDNPEVCDEICNGDIPPEMPIQFTWEFNNITNSKSNALLQGRTALMHINELCSEFEYVYNDFYTHFSDYNVKFNWLSEDEFFANFQQDADGFVFQTDRNIQYVFINGQHFMVVRNPSGAVEWEHFLQEMILAYYKHPENSYDAGETTLSIDVSDLENHPKVKCIYEKLMQSGSLQTFLRQFDDRTGFMNLEIKVTPFSNNNTSTWGETNFDNPSNPTKVVITLNENIFIGQYHTDIEMAAAVLHEVIHAQLYGFLMQVLQVPPYLRDSFMKNNYPGMFDYYVRFKGNTGQNSPQHQIMAAHYIQTMAEKLRLFDAELSQEQAEALAWRGLYVQNDPSKSTIAYNKLSQQKKDEIETEILIIKSLFQYVRQR